MKWLQRLAGVLLSVTVLASSSFALVPADIPGVPKDLRVGPPQTILDQNQGRKHILATAPAITAIQLLDWAEVAYPNLFPKGPQTQQLTYLGVDYVAVRAYPNGNGLGVTSSGMVRGIGPFIGPVLKDIAPLTDFTCQVTPAACGVGGPTTPGSYRADPTIHTFAPNFNKNGKMTWLGAVGGQSFEVAPSEIAAIRWNSNRRGWGADSQSSTPPQADGSLRITGVCGNDRGLPTIITKDGKELWPDFSAKGYQLVGDAAPKIALGLIEYGGYQPAVISAVKEADNTVTLTVDFGTNCAFGFGKDNKLVTVDPMLPLMFTWNSDKAGANREAGWGIQTSSPSIRQAYFDEAQAKAGRLVVKFANMACRDAGDVTVYRAKSVSADGKTVTYDPSTDGFGAGWLVVPKLGDANPIWQAGPGVVWNPEKFQITWDVPLCTQK